VIRLVPEKALKSITTGQVDFYRIEISRSPEPELLFNDDSKVDTLGAWYKGVNFGHLSAWKVDVRLPYLE